MAVVNEGSVLMQARWDWADNTISGKWGTTQQVYRHPRPFVAANQDEGELIDGYPIVVTKNKVRGKGRALQIKFEAEEGKDAHILGWAVNFNISSGI